MKSNHEANECCLELADMKAERDRYRETLEKIILIANETGYGLFANIARAALARDKEQET